MKRLLLFAGFFMGMPLIAKPIIIGHRGASGYEPENTLRSFKRAIEMGVSMIELDVFVCASGELVVIHDDTIDRTTNGKGKVKELTCNTLKNYAAGKGEHIPLLPEVFDLVATKASLNIELKDPDAAKPVAELINNSVQNKKSSYDNYIVSSFNAHAIREFHTYCPHVKTGMIFENNSIDYVKVTKQLRAHYIVIDYKLVTKKLIDSAHNNELKVFAYTVNNKKSARRLQALNIDGIITDYPDILD